MRQNNKLKAFLKKTASLLLFFSILVLNEACQSTSSTSINVVIRDEIRKSHSKELLNQNADNDAIKAFYGDENFQKHIVNYVRKMNKKINAERFTQTLMDLSRQHAYDPIFLLAVIKTESGFNFNAIGSAGEIGLMQIKPQTAQWICKLKNIKWKGAKALKDPEYNILVGAYYFKYLKKTLKSQSMKYVNAYNMGLASMKRMPSANLVKHPYFGKVTKNYLRIYADLKKIKEKNINTNEGVKLNSMVSVLDFYRSENPG